MVPYGSPEDIGVIQLAWLGDSVWELHQRLRHVHFPLKSKDLHLSVVNEVKAKSQSKSLSQIEHLLNSNEMDLIRRARNKTKRYPKSSDPTIYSRATGFETLIGWLFLKDPQRLSTLFEYLELKMNLTMKKSSKKKFPGKNNKEYKKSLDFSRFSKNTNRSEKNDRFLNNSSKNKKVENLKKNDENNTFSCLLYTSPSPRDIPLSRMPSSA